MKKIWFLFLIGLVLFIFVYIVNNGYLSKEFLVGAVNLPTLPDFIPQEEIDKMIKESIERSIGGGTPSTATTEEFSCDRTPLQREFDTNPYYTGTLVDSHLHMPSAFGIPPGLAQQVDWNLPVIDRDISKAEIVCLFDKENIQYAFGFYLVLNPLASGSVQAVKVFDQQYPGRVIPFITPSHITGMDLSPAQIEEVLTANPGLFKGYGEIALYKGSYQGLSPDDRTFREIYEIADRHNLIVMIHADQGQQRAIEKILRDYPNVEFLFHGNIEMGLYATEIVSQYPNAYFTIDADLWDIPSDHDTVNLYAAKDKTEFITDFRRDYNRVLNGALTRWKGAIENNPEKFLWGTDRAYEMHFDPEVGALLEEMGRSFIGQLDPAVQEKFAYKNAERLMPGR